MAQGGVFDELVACLYEAGVGWGGVSWEQALAGVRRAVDGYVVVLLAVDLSRGSLLFYAEAGDAPPEALLDYTRSYHQIDPRLAHVLPMEAGRWVHCHELFDEDFIANDRFYQEFLLPYGGRWVSGIKLMQEGDTAVIFAVNRRPEQGPLVGEAFVLCDRLAWHVAKAYKLHTLRAQAVDRPTVVETVLHRLCAPVFLLDADCGIRFSNQRARALTASGRGLYERDGRLACRHGDSDRVLRATATALFGQPGDDRFPPSAYVPLATSGHVGVAGPAKDVVVGVLLSSLVPERTIGAYGPQPVLLAVAHDHHGALDPDPAVVASAFRLTFAEAEVAIGLTHGLSVEQIAEQRVKAVSTVRSQVKSMFEKMGCTRQGEVVSRVLSMPMIFLGSAGGSPAGRRSSKLLQDMVAHMTVAKRSGRHDDRPSPDGL